MKNHIDAATRYAAASTTNSEFQPKALMIIAPISGWKALPMLPTMLMNPAAVPEYLPPMSTIVAQLAAWPKSKAAAATHSSTVACSGVLAYISAIIDSPAVDAPSIGKIARYSRLRPVRATSQWLSEPPTMQLTPPKNSGPAVGHSERS